MQNLSLPIMKQVFPFVEQLPPLYMYLVKGREDFTPELEETSRLVCLISTYLLPQFFFSYLCDEHLLVSTKISLFSIRV